MSSGPAGWKKLYRRVLAMERAEIADRVRQQAIARLDLLRFKAGADFAPQMQPVGPEMRPGFFFSPEAVPALCAKLREHFPEQAEQIVERAERICEHRFDLLGYDAVDYGPEMDWHCDRVHGKRAPRKPWFRIKYLDFSEVGDSKVTWELNRHQHLVTLAKAFRLSGNQKFSAELFRQWEHWQAENPYPMGINWSSSLEVAFRSLSWLWVYFLLANSPVMPAGFRAAWLRSLAVAGRHIDLYLSTYFSPNTHLLGEAVALFFIGTLVSGNSGGPALASSVAGRSSNRRRSGRYKRRSAFRAVALLPRLRPGFFPALGCAGVGESDSGDHEIFDRTLERMLDALAVLAREWKRAPVRRRRWWAPLRRFAKSQTAYARSAGDGGRAVWS